MYSHMPFLYPDGIVFAAGDLPADGGPVRWKLRVGRSVKSAERLPTGLPDDVIECSPSVAKTPDGVEVVFIVQADGDYRFYRLTGPTLFGLSPAEPLRLLDREGAHAGTRSTAFEAVDRPEIAAVEVCAFGQPAFALPYEVLALDAVARITFEYRRPWRMLVSGRMAGEWHTTLYDLKTNEMFRILLADGSGVYKASLDGDALAYTARMSEAFEAREIRFADGGAWRLLPLAIPDRRRFVQAVAPASGMALGEAAVASDVAAYRASREACLRANCANGRFCAVCRNHADTRTDLETLGLVDRAGEGCPRGLAWDAPPSALAAIRPDLAAGPPAEVWCERFGIGTTPAACQVCVTTRQSREADVAARHLMRLHDRGREQACAARERTARRRLQDCCGREGKEVAVYQCCSTGREVQPADCAACRDRQPPADPKEGKPC